MKIWFDISNSPHINLFANLIKDLVNDHEVIITSRPLANTIDLLDLYGFHHHVVGKHYGKIFFYKLFGYPIRVFQLYQFLRKKKVDIAISQSSFHSPLAAWLLGVPSIYMNDNEHALGNIPSFIFAQKILVPEFFKKSALKKQFAKESKIIHYPGLKEGIYLWNKPINRQIGNQKTIYVRPEPLTAQYYKGALNFLDDTIVRLAKHAKVVVLPRGNEQARYYKQNKFYGIAVQEAPLSIEKIAANCTLFIGAGGTMTREMAVLGISTISVYQDELLEVDKYLIKSGMMIHDVHLEEHKLLSYLEKATDKPVNKELLDKGKTTYNLIKNLLTNKNQYFQ